MTKTAPTANPLDLSVKSKIWKMAWTLLVLAFAISATAEMSDVAAQFMEAMQLSMSKMQKGMTSAPMSGNVDHDFATMMIPHHEGAIDMARAELSYGKDPVMRRLAQEILVDQQSEIDAMQLWLGKTQRPEPKKE
jgi:uncharacterized protein (DUF305 family)